LGLLSFRLDGDHGLRGLGEDEGGRAGVAVGGPVLRLEMQPFLQTREKIGCALDDADVAAKVTLKLGVLVQCCRCLKIA
jgi:hypothetical protein